MSDKDTEIESLVRALIELGQITRLSSEDSARARELMSKLKSEGYSNEDISRLTGHVWSPNTIKMYTKGARMRGSGQQEESTELFASMVSLGLSLRDVKETVGTVQLLKSKGLSLEGVSVLLEEAEKARIKVSDLLSSYQAVRQHNIPVERLAELYAFKGELEGDGYSADILKEFLQLVQTFGEPGAVMESLKEYGSTQKVRAELLKVSEEKEHVERKRDALASELSSMQARYDGLKNVNSICETLLIKYGFTPSSLDRLLEVAEKYQSPSNTLEAVAKYNSLLELHKEIEAATKSKNELEERVKYLRSNLQSLQEREQDLNLSLQEGLESANLQLASASAVAAGNITRSFQNEMAKIRAAVDQYAKNAADAAVLEEELRLARVIQAVTKYPAELDDEVTMPYAILFLELAERMLKAKNRNLVIQNTGFSITDLIRACLQTLHSLSSR